MNYVESGTHLATPTATQARSMKGMPVDRVLYALVLACRSSAAAGKQIASAGKLATGRAAGGAHLAGSKAGTLKVRASPTIRAVGDRTARRPRRRLGDAQKPHRR